MPAEDGKKFTKRDLRAAADARAIALKHLQVAKKRREKSPQALPYVPLPEMRVPGLQKLVKGDDHWCDISERILYANRVLLCAFVERELYNPKNVQCDWEWSEHYRQTKRTIDKLYLYFRRDRPKIEAAIEAEFKKARAIDGDPRTRVEQVPGEPYKRVKTASAKASACYRRAVKLEEKMHATDTEMLCDLMRIRGALWT